MGNNKGFSLIEVMIAGAIGISLVLSIAYSINQQRNLYKKFEKKTEFDQIKAALTRILSDYPSWQRNPENEVPKSSNSSNFYFYKKGEDKLSQLTVLGEVGSKANNCPQMEGSCRLIFISKNGQILNVDEDKLPETNFYRAYIEILTSDDNVSRGWLPELRVTMDDPLSDKSTSAPRTVFYVNHDLSSSKSKNSSEQYDVFPEVRAECYTTFIDKYPTQFEVGYSLCEKATSLAPIECYVDAVEKAQLSSTMAQVLCSNTQNLKPLHCLVEAIKKFELPMMEASILCSRAINLGPIECFDKIKYLDLPTNPGLNFPKVKICSRAMDTRPAACLARIVSYGGSIGHALYLCPHHK